MRRDNTHTHKTKRGDGMEGKDRRWKEGSDSNCMLLTKGCNNGTCDAVGHTDCKDTHGPGVLQAKLELIGLTLQMKTQTE